MQLTIIKDLEESAEMRSLEEIHDVEDVLFPQKREKTELKLEVLVKNVATMNE